MSLYILAHEIKPIVSTTTTSTTTTKPTTKTQTTTLRTTTTTTLRTTTTTQAFANTSILVLNTKYAICYTSTLRLCKSNPPLITDSNGKIEYGGTDFDFTHGPNTEVYESCSLTWRGDFYIFGGSRQKTQIAKLSGCELERIGSLLFDHKRGACTNDNDKLIYLCFNEDDSDYKKCRRSNYPSGFYVSISDSKENHLSSKLGSNKGQKNH